VRLARVRRAAGHTQESLAELLGLDRSTVVRWERAETEPQPWIRSRLARALGVSAVTLDEMLSELVVVEAGVKALAGSSEHGKGLLPSSSAGRASFAQHPEQDLRCGRDPAATTALLRDLVEATDVDRRHFLLLTGGTLTSFAHDWLFDPDAVGESLAGKRVGHLEVDGLDQIADIRRKLHDTVSANDLLPPALTDLRLVIRILESASYSDEVGTRLYATAAEFARLAGILSFEDGQHAAAQHYLLAGLRAAHLSGDRTLGANILVSLAEQANELDHPSDAVRLTESALMVGKDLTPAVAARVNGHLAAAACMTGDCATADRVIGRVFDLTAASEPATEPSWIYWWSSARADMFAGRVALTADRPQQAERYFVSAVEGLDAAIYPQDRVRNLYRLAAARLQLGEVEGACTTAAEAAALTRDLASERLRTQLCDFRRLAQPYASTAAVATFDVNAADLLQSSTH
jgi:transcriptional regulator with XRE-family HTH domain/tetratricopeptide (TPR) repeat protein